MGVINSSLVEGGVFSEEVNKKECADYYNIAHSFLL